MAHPPSARAAATHKTHEMRRRARTVTLRNPTPDPTRDAPTTAGDVDIARHRSRLDAYPPPGRHVPLTRRPRGRGPCGIRRRVTTRRRVPKKSNLKSCKKPRGVDGWADGGRHSCARARGRARRRDARARARERREGRDFFFASSFVVVRRGSIAVRRIAPASHRIASHRSRGRHRARGLARCRRRGARRGTGVRRRRVRRRDYRIIPRRAISARAREGDRRTPREGREESGAREGPGPSPGPSPSLGPSLTARARRGNRADRAGATTACAMTMEG